MNRLNLGCGGQQPDGWINVDRAAAPYIHDITQPWPWMGTQFDGIVCHHVLDLLDLMDAIKVVHRCWKVLRAGGILRISLADVDAGIEAAFDGKAAWFPEPIVTTDHATYGGFDLEATLGHFILQGGARRWYAPRVAIVAMLKAAGFPAPAAVEFARTRGPQWITDLDSRPGESMFVEATK